MRSSEGTCVAALERSLGDSPDGDVEFVATLEGREVRCINYDAWLLTQEYFDDLRFRGASFVVFGGFGSPLLVLEQDLSLIHISEPTRPY